MAEWLAVALLRLADRLWDLVPATAWEGDSIPWRRPVARLADRLAEALYDAGTAILKRGL